jgi:hypothetical protein
VTVKEFFEGDKRMVALTLMALCAALAFSAYFIEGAFRGADTKKAVTLVQDYQIGPTSDEQIARYLQNKFPGEHRWHGEVLSSCHGYVRVTAQVPTPRGVATYLWDVDLVKAGIHPANEAGKALLLELEAMKAARSRAAQAQAREAAAASRRE